MWSFSTTAAIALALGFGQQVSGAATWPSSYDELEDIMVLNQGYRARQLSLPVTPCSFQIEGGHLPAAGFVRTAFHDVAPHDASAGTGGLDASLAFELTGDAGKLNAGPAFNSSLTFLSRFYSTQAPMSDLIALGLYTAVRSCGGPIIPIRTGRKDATEAGPLGVPKVTDPTIAYKDSFARMGFSTQDMIKMVACGHTLGGVHAQQFPDTVTPGAQKSDMAPFDTTPATFDNNIAVEFVSNKTIDPLVTGPDASDSDTRVFNADGGVTIRQLTDAQVYQNTCQDILQRMIDTVPSDVHLTDPIQVYDVKPGAISLTLTNDGETIVFAGEVRVRTTNRPLNSIGSVSVVYKDRNGHAGSTISTTLAGTASGYDDSFAFYSFSAPLSANSSISSFNVVVTGTDGSTTVFDNNGHSYAVEDIVFVQLPSCSLTGSNDGYGKRTVEVVVAVRNGASSVTLDVNLQEQRDVPLPLLTTTTITLTVSSTMGPYTLYSATFTVTPDQIVSATFDVSAVYHGNTVTQIFQKLIGFGLPSSDSSSGGSQGSPWEDWSPAPAPTSSAFCGADAGCDAQPWATETIWAVPTPTNPMAHTEPAGPCPGSATPTWGSGPAGQAQPTTGTWMSSYATGGHSPVAPTASVHSYTGGAEKISGLRNGLYVLAATFVWALL